MGAILEPVIITGGRGFLGRFVAEELKRRGVSEVHQLGSVDCDLVDPSAVNELFARIRPASVIHLAAAVGGIGANVEQAGWFSYANSMMGANVLEAARVNGVAKTLIIGTVCVYPADAEAPTPETGMFEGFPAADTAAYGIAKRNLWMMAAAFRRQYGMNAIYVIPTNLYGPHDHFEEHRSHVIPALIKRAIEAKQTRAPELVVWGDGTATRDFLYVNDAARGIVDALATYDSDEPVNIGSGRETTIRELVETIVERVGYEGRVRWDTDKPVGAPRRLLDISRAKAAFGFEPLTDLRTGLGATIDWFQESQNPDRGAGR